MLEITKTQKKIIIFSLGGLFLFGFAWFFIYFPQSKRVKTIERKLSSTEADIAEIISITKNRDLGDAVRDFRIELSNLSKQLPRRDDVIIAALTKAARDLNVKINNISFSTRRLSEKQVPGLKIEEIPITMRLVCEFRSLGQFLTLLRSNFPILIKVEKLDIQGQEGKPNLSEITLEVVAYLSKEK